VDLWITMVRDKHGIVTRRGKRTGRIQTRRRRNCCGTSPADSLIEVWTEMTATPVMRRWIREREPRRRLGWRWTREVLAAGSAWVVESGVRKVGCRLVGRELWE